MEKHSKPLERLEQATIETDGVDVWSVPALNALVKDLEAPAACD